MHGSVANSFVRILSNFDASSLASKFSIFANQIAASTAPTEITSGQTGSMLMFLINEIIKFVYYLIYSVCRFALNFVDFCEVLVNKLSGIAGQKEVYSPQADFDGNPIFKFLTHDAVLTTFLVLIGLAIVMVIVFAIIAIVKAEYDAYSDDKENAKGPIIRRALKSCFLFLAAPIFLFVFIIGSNAVLNSVNQAFKTNIGNYSLGGQIFVSSTYNANRYRTYAARGTRAPIMYGFKDPAQTGFVNVMTPEQIANAYASWDNSKELYNAFASQKYSDFSSTVVYKNNKLYNSSSYSGFENFVTTAEEYYLMADFLDYAVGNSLEYYIKAMSDSDIDWESVKGKIGLSLYYSIVNSLRFSVPYSDVSGITDNLKYYIKEYVNSNGVSTTPIAAAISTISQILAVGDYSENTFRVLERVNGYNNYVRWKSEMAKDSDGSLLRVYVITKYTYNTTIEELQKRDPITVVLKDGVYYDARKIKDQDLLNAAKGQYAYTCDTTNKDSKVDRVSVDTPFKYDDGTEYRDKNNQPVIIPKDELSVCYKEVSFPEKLYNDLMIIYSDIGIENFIANNTWDSVVTNSGIDGNVTGAVNIPTAFINPLGIIMSELFLGKQLETEDGASLANYTYSSVYSKDTIDALVLALGGEFNYDTLTGQISAFERIFNNMMSQILDDAAYKESVSGDNFSDSVSINSYKQYLASILLSDSFKEYFADVSQDIVLFNRIIEQLRRSEITGAFTSLNKTFQEAIKNVYAGLSESSLSKNALKYYINDVNPLTPDGKPIVIGNNIVNNDRQYVVNDTSSYKVRTAADANYSGKDLNQLYNNLKKERTAAISRFVLLGTEASLNAIYSIDDQIYSLQKYLIISSFREYVSEKTNNSITINMNGYSYNVLLTLTTTEIAELAFGNQLMQVAPEFYTSSDSFLYVNPNYEGLVKLNFDEKGNINGYQSSFKVLRDFIKKFGNVAFELNKSNFVNIGFGTSDKVYGDVFYKTFSDYILNDMLKAFPDLARQIGLISMENNVFANQSFSTLNSWGFFEGKNDFIQKDGDFKYDVVSYTIDKVSHKDSLINYDIKLSIALTYTKDKMPVTETITKVIPSSALSEVTQKVVNPISGKTEYESMGLGKLNRNNEFLVQSLIDYWGFGYSKSKLGYDYAVQIEKENGVGTYYVVIDGARYNLVWSKYKEVRPDNSVIVSENEDENVNGGYVINFVNGKSYLANSSNNPQSVTLGCELVGKTLIDYRRDALIAITNLDTRAGETELELSDRFLSMFYFLCANYQDVVEENNRATSATLVTENFSKSLVKELAGVLNRPDETLVGKEFSEDLGVSSRDEANGTVFIICTFDKTTEKYVPFLVATNNSDAHEFSSKYVVNPYGNNKLYFPVVAKGIIDENGNPTAIRVNEKGDVEFYRNDIYIVNASSLGISMYYQSIEDVKVKGSVVSTIVNGITKAFTGKTLTQMMLEKIPRLSADMTLNFAYGNKETVVGTVKNGYLPMSYDFSVLGIDSFYSVQDLNIIILLTGTIMIVLALFAAVWGLIQRIFDIVVLFLVAPPVIATIPLESNDNSGKFVTWKDKMVSSVLSVYGIIIGLNAFFLFVPYINTLNFFEPGSKAAIAVMQNGVLRHFGDINFVNYLFRVLFLLAAIGLIRRAPKLFAPLITPGDSQDIFSKGEETQKNVRAAVDTVKDHVSGQYAMDKAAKIAGTAVNMVPGAAIAKKAVNKTREVAAKAGTMALEIYARAHGVPKEVARKAAENLNKQIDKKRSLNEEGKNKNEQNRDSREEARGQR